MREDSPKILIISSVTYGSGVLGINIYEAFKEEGYDVDFLTREETAGHPEFINVLEKKSKIKKFTPCHIIKALFKRIFKGKEQEPGYCFFYKDEKNPAVDISKVVAKINKQYDFVYVVFWQELLSYATIKAIDEKLGGVPWIFSAVDFSTMTGGCHFPLRCDRWKNECGCCPAWDSNNPDDFTHKNILYRKELLKKLDVTISVNSFQKDNYFSKSKLYKDAKYILGYPLINENEFCPLPKDAVLKEFGLPKDKKIILFGCQTLGDEYKGMTYLLEALDKLYERMNEKERKSVLLLSVGKSNPKVHESIRFEYKDVGYVSLNTLSKLYAVADIFACPSIFDPGPMMVNQALSCGTPVVAFNQGTIVDVNRYAKCGYTAKLKDTDDFCNGLLNILSMKEKDYKVLRKTCRQTALKMTSRHAIVQSIMDYYYSNLRR